MFIIIDPNVEKIVPKGVDPSTRMTNFVTTFDPQPDIPFYDHTSPFRGLLAKMKDEPNEARSKATSKLIKKDRKLKLFAVTTGTTSNADSMRTVTKAVGILCGTNAIQGIEYIEVSQPKTNSRIRNRKLTKT